MKIGRNAPCPCGSGKKFKQCCSLSIDSKPSDLQAFLLGQDFDSIEELQQSADTFLLNQNQMPEDDFHGLTPEQVHLMLNFAFETPEQFTFKSKLSIEPKAPILMLINGIVSAIDTDGLKATAAAGSLPQKLCRDIWEDYKILCKDDSYYPGHKVNKEDDFVALNVARLTLELAGLLRKTKGKFFLTKKYYKIFDQDGLKGLYPIIFRTYCSKFNWGYWDGYKEVPFIQQSFLYTLYLLKLHGDKMISTANYEKDFIKAFPNVVDEFDDSSYSTPEDDLFRCYRSRACKRFLVFLGLAELEITKQNRTGDNVYKIRKTALYEDLVKFNLSSNEKSKIIHPVLNTGYLH